MSTAAVKKAHAKTKAKPAAKAEPPDKVNASQLRADVYNILDRVIETGRPLLIERKGTMLKLDLEKPMSKLERLKRNAKPGTWVGDLEDIFHIDYMKEWREEWGISDEEWAEHARKIGDDKIYDK